MKRDGTKLRLSPSDLSNHLACRHLTALDLAVALGLLPKPVAHSQFLDMLRARGDEHEKAYVASLHASGLAVIDLSTDKALTAEAFDKTRAAMASGAAVIVQAPLGLEGFAGYADVLLRVEVPSDLGAWSYEVIDTKLARETRGGTVLQLCVYSDIVGQYQRRKPERFHVVSPGEPFVEHAYRLDDFTAYYRLVRQRLVAVVAGSAGTEVPAYVRPEGTYPEPTPHCDICRWWSQCEKRRRADDHLSLVAGIRRTQRAELERHGVTTLTVLAQMPLPLAFKPDRGSRQAMTRVREQARVQLQGRTSGAPYYELLPIEGGDAGRTARATGLGRLPPPSPGDIFLDFEGDPFAGTSGLEYLFGCALGWGGGGRPPSGWPVGSKATLPLGFRRLRRPRRWLGLEVGPLDHQAPRLPLRHPVRLQQGQPHGPQVALQQRGHLLPCAGADGDPSVRLGKRGDIGLAGGEGSTHDAHNYAPHVRSRNWNPWTTAVRVGTSPSALLNRAASSGVKPNWLLSCWAV
jgi:predicted RecB family nuclease